ncbi:MAG: hypothetical protein DMG57_24860 [Acidobacteria bacterium]|nr:MAG: hypothetical protein DMG57_24860 [Acidobacteriota bacterium]
MNKAKVFVCYTTHLFTAGCNGIDKQLVSSGGDRRENKQRPGVTAHIGLVLGAEKEGVQVHPFLDVASRQYSMFIMKLGMGNLEGTKTILIVDDEISDLSLTRAMLTRYGYTVLIASSAAEALHLFERYPAIAVDLAVVDIVMPEMDGFELAEQLQQIRPQMPIIYISAHPDRPESWREMARKFPFVPKSFTSLQLIHKVREALDIPHSISAAQRYSRHSRRCMMRVEVSFSMSRMGVPQCGQDQKGPLCVAGSEEAAGTAPNNCWHIGSND